ncbi:hypothetical protein K3552_19745 (plasmid) [Leisingera aquaemixtae]|uniref:hypothetical protein n=1 Tax=Leisingera aquaemixtae TaxID=1396826 RepID=UPI0021A523E4|nr:hypothetical protein [Leisingera aquaemixtae]UWQ39547.1 hypothetical protein K3552_19745 [Leisingera aquaemixtae]
MHPDQIGDSTKPFMPDEEIAYLTEVYRDAKVILEYGSGGTTRIAASLPGKFTMSVESDQKWALKLQQEIDASNPASPAIIYHTDIGPVGPWGRPVSIDSWRHFFRYPLDIWEKTFFRHPDTILIDGRMRTACLAMVMLRCTQPVTVLFDDYGVRPMYHEVEKLIRPTEIRGRLARFEVKPDMIEKPQLSFAVKQFAMASIDGEGEAFYRRKARPW